MKNLYRRENSMLFGLWLIQFGAPRALATEHRGRGGEMVPVVCLESWFSPRCYDSA